MKSPDDEHSDGLEAELESLRKENAVLLVAIEAKDVALKTCKHGYQGFSGKEWSFDLKLVQEALALSPSTELLEARDGKRDAKLLRELSIQFGGLPGEAIRIWADNRESGEWIPEL